VRDHQSIGIYGRLQADLGFGTVRSYSDVSMRFAGEFVDAIGRYYQRSRRVHRRKGDERTARPSRPRPLASSSYA
jgi:hypothetical protein